MFILPIIFFLFCILALIKRGLDWRYAFIITAVLWGCLVTTFTEFLSLFSLFNESGLVVCWATSTLVVLILLFRQKKSLKAWKIYYSFSTLETVVWGGLSSILLATFITAIVAPPNNFDSMTYHMSRVVHWLQNDTVAHYPTHNIRQIELNPWAEFAISQFQALSFGDRYSNLVQWFSMVGSIIGATLVAEELGGENRVQLFTAVIVGTIPMGILQASSTQNDYVVSFWLICFVFFCLKFFKQKEFKRALMAGVCLGLAILTKGTAYIFALPFFLWIIIIIIRSKHFNQAVLLIITIAFPVLILNVGHYSRNMAVFSNPIISGETSYSNEIFSVKTTMSNIARNTSVQFSTPFIPINNTIGTGVKSFHDLIGADVNDSRTTFGGISFNIPMLVQFEDTSGNLLHALLAVISIVLLFSRRLHNRLLSVVIYYILCLTGGFILFNILLKWQPWHSRLELPLFVLGGPIIGIMLTNLRFRYMNMAIIAVLLIGSLPWTLWNISRPLTPRPKIISNLLHRPPLTHTIFTADRITQYFKNKPDLQESYLKTSQIINERGAQHIGLIMGRDDWEYPLWVLLKGQNTKVHRIEHIDVTNRSGLIALNDFKPDLVIKFNKSLPSVVQKDK